MTCAVYGGAGVKQLDGLVLAEDDSRCAWQGRLAVSSICDAPLRSCIVQK